jgi:hypothetical protein
MTLLKVPRRDELLYNTNSEVQNSKITKKHQYDKNLEKYIISTQNEDEKKAKARPLDQLIISVPCTIIGILNRTESSITLKVKSKEFPLEVLLFDGISTVKPKQREDSAMAYEPKPGQFSLFKNDKEGNDARPDYKGTLALESGEVVRIAGWLKDGAKGKFLSLKVDKPRDDREAVKSDGRASSGGVSGGRGVDPFDDVPW